MQNNPIINHKKYQLKKNERKKNPMSDFDRCNVHMIIKKAKD